MQEDIIVTSKIYLDGALSTFHLTFKHLPHDVDTPVFPILQLDYGG